MTDNNQTNELGEASPYGLPNTLGMHIVGHGEQWVHLALEVEEKHMAPNGFLHAGTVVSLADSACGFACARSLPPEASGFTTVELKSNFMGTAREGVIEAKAQAVHLGRSTHVWDAIVTHRDTGKTIAMFRCTQMILRKPG